MPLFQPLNRKRNPLLASKRKPKKRNQRRRQPRRWLRWLTVLIVLAVVAGVVSLDFIVRAKFNGSKWALPAHVYGRSLELYEGQALGRGAIRWELDQLGYRAVDSVTAPGQYRLAGSRLELHTRPFRFWDGDEPARRITLGFDNGRVVTLHNPGGASLARLEPLLIGGIYPEHNEDRVLMRLEAMPPLLLDGLIAVEDRDFHRHYGVSPRAIVRAMVANLRAGGTVQGGSTITQQLVKNFYLTRDRTLVRKGLEAVMAVLLELHYSKAEILEAYINEVYLGQVGNRAIHGMGLASRHYFRQPPSELEAHQVALLIALVKGPSHYDPWRHPQRARARRDLVLDSFLDTGLLDKKAAARDKARGLDIARRPGTAANPFPDYLDMVRRDLSADYRDSDLRSAGLRVFTHFDPQVQRQVEDSIATVLGNLEAGYRLPEGELEAASLVVRTGTADVLAVAGGRRPGFAGFNRALDARRQAGSTLKPAVYLTALEQPRDYTLTTAVDDSPVSVKGPDGIWQPRNFDRESHGEVPLFEALGHSYNQATARLGMTVGLSNVAQTIRRLGYDGPIREVPSLLLGSLGVTPEEITILYHTIASEGFYTPLRTINTVHDADNEPLRRYPFGTEQRFSPEVMHLLQYGLQVAVREGTGKGVYNRLSPTLAAAGKTGTTNDQRDSWFAGFAGNYVGVVWVGRDDNGVMPLTGATGALPIWTDIMAGLSVGSLPFVRPEGVDYHWVDPATHSLSGEQCRDARYVPYLRGSAPERKGTCIRKPGRDIVDWFRDVFGL